MSEELATYNAPIATTPQTNQAMVEVEQQRSIAEVQGAIILAKKFPEQRTCIHDHQIQVDDFGFHNLSAGQSQ